MSKNPLGESTDYPQQYELDILHQIPRLPARLLLDIDEKIKMYGNPDENPKLPSETFFSI